MATKVYGEYFGWAKDVVVDRRAVTFKAKRKGVSSEVIEVELSQSAVEILLTLLKDRNPEIVD